MNEEIFKCVLISREFGSEVFEYDTLAEAKEGFNRLKESAKKHQEEDGIERAVMLIIDEYNTADDGDFDLIPLPNGIHDDFWSFDGA